MEYLKTFQSVSLQVCRYVRLYHLYLPRWVSVELWQTTSRWVEQATCLNQFQISQISQIRRCEIEIIIIIWRLLLEHFQKLCITILCPNENLNMNMNIIFLLHIEMYHTCVCNLFIFHHISIWYSKLFHTICLICMSCMDLVQIFNFIEEIHQSRWLPTWTRSTEATSPRGRFRGFRNSEGKIHELKIDTEHLGWMNWAPMVRRCKNCIVPFQSFGEWHSETLWDHPSVGCVVRIQGYQGFKMICEACLLVCKYKNYWWLGNSWKDIKQIQAYIASPFSRRHCERLGWQMKDGSENAISCLPWPGSLESFQCGCILIYFVLRGSGGWCMVVWGNLFHSLLGDEVHVAFFPSYSFGSAVLPSALLSPRCYGCKTAETGVQRWNGVLKPSLAFLQR